MVIDLCVKYGKPMSNQNKVMGPTRICTDRRKNRVIPIYPLNFIQGGYNKVIILPWSILPLWINTNSSWIHSQKTSTNSYYSYKITHWKLRYNFSSSVSWLGTISVLIRNTAISIQMKTTLKGNTKMVLKVWNILKHFPKNANLQQQKIFGKNLR